MTYEEVLHDLEDAARTYAMLTMPLKPSLLEKALCTVESAEAVGWVTDPTKYRDAIQDGRLDRQRALLKSAIAFRKALAGIFPDYKALLAATAEEVAGG